MLRRETRRSRGWMTVEWDWWKLRSEVQSSQTTYIAATTVQIIMQTLKQEAHQLVGPGDTCATQLENLQLGLSCIAFTTMCKVRVICGCQVWPTKAVEFGDLRSNCSRLALTTMYRVCIWVRDMVLALIASIVIQFVVKRKHILVSYPILVGGRSSPTKS